MTSAVKPFAMEKVDVSSLLAGKEDKNAVFKTSAEQVQSANLTNPNQEIDKFWIWPKEMRPTVQHDCFDAELPIIDLAPSLQLERLRNEAARLDSQSTERSSIEADIQACEAATVRLRDQMREACEKYGFFQVINHGMPLDVIEEFKQSCSWLFEFPDEVRKRVELVNPKDFAPFSSGFQSIHRSSPINKTGDSHFWNEAFDIECPEMYYPGRMDEIINALWPGDAADKEKGQQFKSRAEQYGLGANKVAMHLLELLAASLGLTSPEPLLGHGPESDIEGRLRVNHYPVCAQPELTWGIHSHTDPSVLTILYQGEIGGLQINFPDGSWHGVRPVPGAFVVNVGDYLQATTNGRFLSAQHQVVANSKFERYSLVYFAGCPKDFVLKPASQLVDKEHPLRYKPFNRTEYRRALLEHGLNSREKHLLEAVFGVESEV